MLFLIQRFEPQLKHYSRRLYSEDAQSELTLRFIEIIHAMNLDALRSQGDGTIVAYLAQSVRNAYISLLSSRIRRLSRRYPGKNLRKHSALG